MSYRHPISPLFNPQKLALTSSSAQSAPVGATSKGVRVCSDVDCWVAVGSNPTATTSSFYLPAKFPQVLGCEPGDKVAGITASTGNLYITEELQVQ